MTVGVPGKSTWLVGEFTLVMVAVSLGIVVNLGVSVEILEVLVSAVTSVFMLVVVGFRWDIEAGDAQAASVPSKKICTTVLSKIKYIRDDIIFPIGSAPSPRSHWPTPRCLAG